MSGDKVRYSLTLIFLLPLVAACGPSSSGFVFDSDYSSNARGLRVIPLRDEYRAGEFFNPGKDFSVDVITEEGTITPVSVKQVNIGIVTNPDSETPNAPVPISATGAQLVAAMGTGRKLIVVEYPGLDPAAYSIEVRDVLGGNGGSGTGEGSGVHLVWN